MALTRRFLQALGIDDNQIQAIIDEHAQTVNNLQEEINKGKEALTKAQEDSQQFETVQKELDELKKADYKGKYEAEKKEHDALKTSVENGKTQNAKNAALKKYFESKNIKDGNLNIAMRGVNLDDIELDGENIKDTAALDELVAGDYKPLISTTTGGGKKVVDSGSRLGGGGEPENKVLSLAEAMHEKYDKN
jgi:hypothetical protein